MKTIKVGLIGTGYIGVVHLEMLRRLGGVEVVAVADPNGDLARRTAERFGIPRVYADAAALIADREVEVVHDCAPNNVHFEINAGPSGRGKRCFRRSRWPSIPRNPASSLRSPKVTAP